MYAKERATNIPSYKTTALKLNNYCNALNENIGYTKGQHKEPLWQKVLFNQEKRKREKLRKKNTQVDFIAM